MYAHVYTYTQSGQISRIVSVAMGLTHFTVAKVILISLSVPEKEGHLFH